jgi:hypothetical protein
MTLGFSPARLEELRKELMTWALYQVVIDKFYVHFEFENGHCLMNVAFQFEYRSADGTLTYVYDVQASGNRKTLNVDGILRRAIKSVDALDEHRLALTFDGGDILIAHDSATMRSVWFYRYDPIDHDRPLLWCVADEEHESEL